VDPTPPSKECEQKCLLSEQCNHWEEKARNASTTSIPNNTTILGFFGNLQSRLGNPCGTPNVNGSRHGWSFDSEATLQMNNLSSRQANNSNRTSTNDHPLFMLPLPNHPQPVQEAFNQLLISHIPSVELLSQVLHRVNLAQHPNRPAGIVGTCLAMFRLRHWPRSTPV
jgi:hypothetical protein